MAVIANRDREQIETLTASLSRAGASVLEIPPSRLDNEPLPDRRIDLVDLAILLTNFGLATGATQPMGDIDFDGDVDLTDLATLLTQFGTSCA